MKTFKEYLEDNINEGKYHKKQMENLGTPKDEYDIYTAQFRIGGNTTKWMNLTPEVFNKIKVIITKELKD